MIRRLENYVAFVIFGFTSNTDLYLHQPALIWRVAVYSICFILGAVNFTVNGCDCDNEKMLPIPYPSFLMEQTVLSVLLYSTAWSSGRSTSLTRILAGSPSGPGM